MISRKLQQQIKYLCHKESSVEWSGALFYTTEGEFGTDSFKCVAEEVYLMDIGSGAYTEYDYGAEFASFLMKNPRLMTMKRGHIHSHNNMGVFFSGTDTTEIVDNSEHYDYYLSLIVNNRNEMCAKIAFRGTVIEEIKKSIIYNKFSSLVNSEPQQSKVEKTVVFVYDCNIQGADPVFDVDEKFVSRYNEVKQEKLKSSTSNGSFAYSGSVYSSTGYRYSPLNKERQLTVPFTEEDEDNTEKRPRFSWDTDNDDDAPTFQIGGKSFQVEDKAEEESSSKSEDEISIEEDWKHTAFEYMREMLNADYATGVSSIVAKMQAEKKQYSTKGWEWKLEELKGARFKVYTNHIEDPHYKHYDAFVDTIHEMLDNAETLFNKDVVHELKTSVFVK